MIVHCEICGASIKTYASRPRRVCSLKCRSALFSGAGNPKYRGGLFQRSEDGRWVIVCRDGSLMLYARAVAESTLGRPLTRAEVVHHRNGDCTDDDPDNLEVTSQSQHIRLHLPDMLARRLALKKAAA